MCKSQQHMQFELYYDIQLRQNTFFGCCYTKRKGWYTYKLTLPQSYTGNTTLHASSAHPQPLIRSIPFSQYLHIQCNCSDDVAFHMEANNLRDRLLQRGYSLTCLKKTFKKATKRSRQSLLFDKKEFH